jgi:hypothetical protein
MVDQRTGGTASSLFGHHIDDRALWGFVLLLFPAESMCGSKLTTDHRQRRRSKIHLFL